MNIDSWFVTGFTDGEGCFLISLSKDKKQITGWRVKYTFTISSHKKDQALLEQIQSFFGGVGSINSKHGPQSIQLRVESRKDLAVVISHLDKFPLLTKKYADYELFKQAFMLILNKEHLTMEGLRKIVSIKATMNRGLSEELKAAFPKIIPIARPLVKNQKIQDSNWLAGFTSAEGCFMIKTINSSSNLKNVGVYLRFELTQHARDEYLIKSLIEYLGCGTVHKNKEAFTFQVTKFSDIRDKIIPFFAEYPINGTKLMDYLDWCKAAELIQSKAHLTQDGLDEILKIKAGMNKGR